MHIPLSLLAGVCISELSLSTVVFAAIDVVVVVNLVDTFVGAVVVTFSVVSVETVKPETSRR